MLLSQAVVHEFIRRGSFEPNLRRVNEQLKIRRDAMLAALEKHFAGARWVKPDGGYFIWLELPASANSPEILARAKGVAAVAGRSSPGRGTASGLRTALLRPTRSRRASSASRLPSNETGLVFRMSGVYDRSPCPGGSRAS